MRDCSSGGGYEARGKAQVQGGASPCTVPGRVKGSSPRVNQVWTL